MRPLTEKDKMLLDEAYSTTYKSTIKALILQAETDKCREILRELLEEMPE